MRQEGKIVKKEFKENKKMIGGIIILIGVVVAVAIILM